MSRGSTSGAPASERFTLANGTEAFVTANGHVLSSVGGVSYEEDDGTIVDTTPQPGDERSRRHTQTVQAFMKSRQYRRAVRRQRPPCQTRVIGRQRPRGRRERRHVARATSSSDPGGSDSDPPPPPELNLGQHPRYGLVSSNLLRVLKSVAR